MKKVFISMKKVFDGIYSDGLNEKANYADGRIYTRSMIKGNRVYGEKIVCEENEEYREWDPFRSKYCAAVKSGLKESIFFSGAKVLYLGSAEGTSVSHVADIVGEKGFVFGVDISETAMDKLIGLSEVMKNIFPIVADAQSPEEYADFLGGKVDALFQDVSQRNQAEIFLRNARFLKSGGMGALTIKTKSISQVKKKQDILAEEREKLSKEFLIMQVIPLESSEKGHRVVFEKDHYVILVKKK
ncbi:MAG: fibrillarin-like rRNA/tRNA 2'-O-methyltransferase [archaeon]|jgi:fibrillarin-like pre-rRNA processing protein